MSNRSNNLAEQRICRLLDENSFMEIGSLVTARNTDFNLADEATPSDGVITGHGLIDGNLVFVYSQDSSVLNGTIGEMHAKKIAAVYDRAMKMGAPVIGLLDCAGVRLQESVDALNALGMIYEKQVMASGVIPQICAVFGNCGGGLTVVPGLCDFAYMEADKAKMFVNAPNAIEGNYVGKCDTSSADFQSTETGVIDMAGSEEEIFAQIRELVCMLPADNTENGYMEDCEDDLNRACENVDTMKGDPRFVLSEISDNHNFLETKKDYAKSMVTGFIQLNGLSLPLLTAQKNMMKKERKSQSMMQHFVQKAVKKLLNSSSSVMHLIFLYYLLPMWLDLQQQNAAKEDLQKLWLNLHMHLQMLPFLRLACLPVMLTEVQQ